MEMYKDAVCHELREMLTVWEAAQANPRTKLEAITRIRLKIMVLCAILDRIERQEGD